MSNSNSKHLNWIEGRWQTALGSGTFELTHGDAGFEQWPRSREQDLALLKQPTTPSSQRSVASLMDLLEDWTNTLEDLSVDEDWTAELSEDAGLESDELCHALGWSERRADAALDPWGLGLDLGADKSPELNAHRDLVIADWREGLSGTFARVAARLRAGSRVLLLSDPKLPRVGEYLAKAAEECQVPADLFALLHDDSLAVMRATLAFPDAWTWWVCEESDRVAQCLTGIPQERWPQIRVQTLRRGIFRVHHEDDLELAAQELWQRGLSRSATLSGSLPGQAGLVLCHELALSEFTECLLSLLDREFHEDSPPACLDRADWVFRHRQIARGLDEGSCLLFGSAPGASLSGLDSPLAPSRSSAGRSNASRSSSLRSGSGRNVSRFEPAVFTNVSPTLRFSSCVRPAPIVGLVRVTSDEEARELTHALEQRPALPVQSWECWESAQVDSGSTITEPVAPTNL